MPTPDYAALRAELDAPDLAGLDDAAATDALRAATVPGPDVPAPLLESELMGMLSPASFAAVLEHRRFSEFKQDVNAQNHAGVGLWATVFAMLGLISEAERDAVMAYAARTEPGPAVSRGAAAFGQDVTITDVTRARSL